MINSSNLLLKQRLRDLQIENEEFKTCGANV